MRKLVDFFTNPPDQTANNQRVIYYLSKNLPVIIETQIQLFNVKNGKGMG